LPIYHESVIDIVRLLQLQSLYIYIDEKSKLIYNKPQRGVIEPIRFVTEIEYNRFENNEIEIAPHQYPIKMGLIGYVQLYRLFRYPKPSYEKEAIELVVEVEGVQKKFVKWGNIDSVLYKDITGAIVGLILSKNSADRDFQVLKVIVIEPPFVLTQIETEKE
jgi:hypothetical protein